MPTRSHQSETATRIFTMKFDLSALSGSLVEELTPLSTTSTLPQTTSTTLKKPAETTPAPIKGVAAYNPESKEEFEASLVVTWVLAMKGCCFTRASNDWYFVDRASRVLYVFSLVLCVTACILALMYQSTMFIPRNVHWFGWVVFAVFAAQEAILLVGRILVGRYKNLMRRPERAEGQTARDVWRALISYKSFNTGVQAWSVIVLQTASSAAVVAGVLFAVMQSDITFEDEIHNTVSSEYRYAWRVAWISAFCQISIGICLCGWLDAARLDEVQDDAPHFSIELIAWRVMLLTLIIPPMTLGWAIWSAVCCVGPLVWSS